MIKLTAGGLSAAQQQLDELECMFSMFPNDEELKVNNQAKSMLEEYVAGGAKSSRPECRIQYTFYFQDLAFGREVPTLALSCPPGYPDIEQMTFEVQCPQLSRVDMEKLHNKLDKLSSAACGDQEVVGLQLYQQMQEFLSEVHVNTHVNEKQETSVSVKDFASSLVLGRRAIYFHHIIASNKRRVVKEWAAELQLGGFSKIGWPGVVIVEGAEEKVQEYVRRLQHLRWKQITVRGEQTEELKVNCLDGVDSLRRLPRSFHEFPENGMSDLAAACRDAGLENLFLTTMKIYRQSEKTEDERFVSKNEKTSNKHNGHKV